jgi:hypothetical protein
VLSRQFCELALQFYERKQQTLALPQSSRKVCRYRLHGGEPLQAQVRPPAS